MSIFSSIAGLVSKVAVPFLGASKAASPILSTVSKVPLLGTALKAVPGIGTALTAGSLVNTAYKALSASKAVAPAATSLVGTGVKTMSLAKKVALGAGGIAAGTAAYKGVKAIVDPSGAVVGYTKKRRRMNVCNMKAANRAIRRVKGARKMLQKIEKQMPHRTVHSRPRYERAHDRH